MTISHNTVLTGEIVPDDEAQFMDAHADFFDRRIGHIRSEQLASFRNGGGAITVPPAYVIAAMGGA
ncbi:hypothetical protein [Celeribacter sp. SCSIO 80788]|uniref:hypothetical protein n=1 Tax=Celeribacter sp. SCSIO 80788 TaxID=3117013 RepID=UPI003DA4581B